MSLGDQKPVTFGEFAKDFFDWELSDWIKRQHAKGRRFSRSVARSRQGHVARYLIPKWGDRLLSDLNLGEIENWIVSLPLANQTKNHILYTIRIILREAKLRNFIQVNPLAEMEPLGKQHQQRDIFTIDELGKLFPEDANELVRIWGDAEHATAFLLLASTGLRSGELRGLQWHHIIRGKVLYIQQAVKDDETIGPTKTFRPRVAWLFPRARSVLDWWKEQSPWTEPEDYIFPGFRRDKPLNRANLSRSLPGALRRAGLEAEERVWVVHSFRHTYNTMMRKILPEEILRDMTGHRDSRMTDAYDHPSVEDLLLKLEDTRVLQEAEWL